MHTVAGLAAVAICGLPSGSPAAAAIGGTTLLSSRNLQARPAEIARPHGLGLFAAGRDIWLMTPITRANGSSTGPPESPELILASSSRSAPPAAFAGALPATMPDTILAS